MAGTSPRAGSRAAVLIGSLVTVVFALGWSATPAYGAVVDRIRATNTYDNVRWDCGYPMRVVGTSRDVIEVRASKQIDGWVMVNDTYSFDETWTNADGRSFTYSSNGVYKDLPGKPLGGSLYLFTGKHPGIATIRDSTGTVIARDRGVVTLTYTIDFATGAWTLVNLAAHGPHPLFDAGDDMCTVVAPITGTDSARYLTARPIGSTEFPMGFYEYLPPSYSAFGTASPLLIALNGYGENGDGTPGAISWLLGTGIPRFINVGGWPTERPLVVLALQHVQGSSDIWCTTADEVHSFIDYAVQLYNVDPSRVYVTGLSCGAIGTWDYLASYLGQQIAAAVPIAGDGRGAWAAAGCSLTAVPIWAFHGEVDGTVDPVGSIEPMTNIQACPGATSNTAKLTIYPGVDHNSWDQTYSGESADIYSWMLSFTRQ